MASKRRLRRKRCEKKKRYDTQEHANNDAVALMRRVNHRLSVYKCQFCKGWHVGHTMLRYY
jgi:hypothetical protein